MLWAASLVRLQHIAHNDFVLTDYLEYLSVNTLITYSPKVQIKIHFKLEVFQKLPCEIYIGECHSTLCNICISARWNGKTGNHLSTTFSNLFSSFIITDTICENTQLTKLSPKEVYMSICLFDCLSTCLLAIGYLQFFQGLMPETPP